MAENNQPSDEGYQTSPAAPDSPSTPPAAPHGAPQPSPEGAPQTTSPSAAPPQMTPPQMTPPQMQTPSYINGGPQAPAAPGVPQPPAGYPYAPVSSPSKGLALTALILGLVGVVGGLIFWWLPFVGGVITALVGAAALVLGIIAMSKKQSKGMALTGLITGGVAVLMGIGFVIFWGLALSQTQSTLDEYSSSLDELQSELESYEIPDSSFESE